jgi:hypothetical protein
MFTKLDLIERIIATDDEKLLEKVSAIMEKGTREAPLLSKTELAELDKRWAQYKAGKGRSYSRNEFADLLKPPARKR